MATTAPGADPRMYQPYQIQAPSTTYDAGNGDRTTDITQSVGYKNTQNGGTAVPGVGVVSNPQSFTTAPQTIPASSAPVAQPNPTPSVQTPQPVVGPVIPGSPEARARASQQQASDMAKYFPQAHANLSSSGTAAPDNGGAARSAVSDAITAVTPPQSSTNPTTAATEDATTNAVNQYLADISAQNGFEATRESISHYQATIAEGLGIPALQADLLNTQTIMNGTVDDIRAEVQSAGGMATESQIEALAQTRNQVLGKHLNNVQNALSIAQTNLGMAVSSFQGDQNQASNALSTRVSNDANVISLVQNSQTKSLENFKTILTSSGWTGLAQLDPSSFPLIESTFHLAPGTMSNPAKVQALQDSVYKQRSMDLSAQRAQIVIQNQQSGSGDAGTLAQMLVDGQIAPSQLSKRSTGPGSYANILAAANALSMAQTGKPYDARAAESSFDYQSANSTQATQVALRYTVDTLNQLKGLSSKVDRGNVTFGNQAGQWMKYNGSDKATVDFITKANGAIDDVAAALGGGVSTDAKLLIAKRLLDPTLSDAAFKSQVDTDIGTINSRQKSIDVQSGRANSSDSLIPFLGKTYQPYQIVGTAPNDQGVSVTLTAEPDGTISGSDGHTYDAKGNQIN